ncbi:MAG: WHG domain-containing protein, partial [Anaerolineae bacterium]|nr:WHG domain-containing protein [Anaerolineae bacterium]
GLQAITTAYWRFAQENPELYEVMYGLGGIHIEKEEAQKPPEVQAVIAEVLDALAVWAQAEDVTLPDVTDAFQVLWGMIHGLVTLGMSGRLVESKGERDHTHTLLQQGLAAILNGWRQQA